MSTIFALSSGALPSAIAVFRLSGCRSLDVLQRLTRRKVWKPREMRYAKILAADGSLIDTSMAVYLPGPSTFTGEDTSEIFVHGSKAVATALANRLAQFEGVRQAHRGEFTKRAFYNGKMSLEDVRGLQRLISAETERQLTLCRSQSAGSTEIRKLRDQLEEVLMRIYIMMDFGEHVEMSLDEIRTRLSNIADQLHRMKERADVAEMVHNGVKMVLVGKPNAGKSSLMNILAERDVAIVSPHAGTTRDCIQVRLSISGIPVTITDTAGLRENPDEIEAEGIRRTRLSMQEADVILAVVDATERRTGCEQMLRDIKALCPNQPVVIIRNKSDLVSDEKITVEDAEDTVSTCALTAKGVSPLIDCLRSILERICPDDSGPFLAEAQLLEEISESVAEALQLEDTALLASQLERCKTMISYMIDNAGTEELLDRLFAQFCVGK